MWSIWGWAIRTAPRRELVVKKLVEAARNPRNHRYSVSRGIPRLREEIVKRYRTNYGVELDPDNEAIVTIGAKDALAHLLFAVIGPGDAVVSPNPAYPIHQYGVIMAEGHACMLPMPNPADVPQPPGGPLPHVHAQAEDDADLVPAQPHHARAWIWISSARSSRWPRGTAP